MSSKPMGIGFIGAGEVSILHAEAVRRCPDAKLTGLWNRTATLGKERAGVYGCRLYETAEQLIADPEVDAVFVLTNLETHLHYAKLALAFGKPVLVEKPVAASVAEIEEMKQIAEKAGLLCMPGHNMIYEESLVRSRDLIEKGAIGKIVSVYVMYNIQHSEERASTLPGVVRQILTHNSYSMLYLAGKPKRVSAFKACRHYQTITKEDIAMVIIELENGGLAHLCASFAADDLSTAPWTFLIKVIGTEGTTHYTYQDWVETKARAGVSHSRTYTAYQGTIAKEVQHFVNVCRNGGKLLSTLDDAIVAQKMVEAVERSIVEGRAVVIE
jgi:predicted dehydrogenase